MKLITLLLLSGSLTACSSMPKSILAGATAGGTTGALIGNHSGRGHHRNTSTLTGALIGAAFGGTLGYFGFKDKNKKSGKKISKTKKKKKKIKDDTPLLTRPRVKKIWVKDRISGSRFVKGHWEYIIEENSQWNK